ncbi:MAG: ATP-binding protein, partial [Lachnospiraceae bacterium]|nr:ATP-binding protein [Lachnospiraceae bacterium]
LYSMVRKNKSFKNVYDYPKLEDEKKNILLIFDEADSSMHPRWQRMFMKWLTDFCNQLFQNVSVKIIITTHSPVLLSDFPANSILYLTKSEGKKINHNQSRKATFGSNIHSLYLNAFFLEDHGTMGAFAEEKINEIADKLLQESIAEIDHERIEKEIRYLGEGIIRDKLEETLNNKSRKKINQMNDTEKMIISDTLARLKEQRNYMDQLIRELEEKADDKNRYR